MPYQVRAKRSDNGYSVSYGRGSRKLTIRLIKRAATRWSFIDAPSVLQGVYSSFNEAKIAFDTWAQTAYGEENGEVVTGSDPASPAIVSGVKGLPTIPSRKKGPPTYRRDPSDVQSENQYTADPLDPEFYTADENGRRLTPLGVLDEVWSWVMSHVDERKHDIYPWANVAKVLQRALPDRKRYQKPTLRSK